MTQVMPFAAATRGLIDSFAPDGVFTFSKPARSLNSVFIPSTTRPSFVAYSVDIDCDSTITITGGTTEAGRAQIQNTTLGQTITQIINSSQFSGTVLVGVAIVNRQRITSVLSAIVGTNQSITIQTAADAGAPAFTLNHTAEWVL